MALIIRSVLHLLVISLISFVIFQQRSDADQEVLMLQKPRLINCKFDKIYQFGDSLSDTGNCIRESICGAHTACSRHPYGMDFFEKKITGRCSNGMLMIDFIAVESGLPLLNPIKDQTANFRHGANFAVAGATALPAEIILNMNVHPSTNSSLSVQLDWMSSHLETTCYTDRPEKLSKSLFIVGEIGGNEFAHGLLEGKTIEELRIMMPEVVEAIIHGVRRVISLGASRIVVPGNFPSGCFPVILTKLKTDNSSAYDEHHCLIDFNNLIIFFNDHLRQAIEELKKEYPNITLIYGDYYNAYLSLLKNAASLGFEKKFLQKACCGIGGAYNFNVHKKCGNPGVGACVDLSSYVSWDGSHLTQKAYSWLTRWLIDTNILPQLNCQA